MTGPKELPETRSIGSWTKADPHASSEVNRETANARPASGAASSSDDAGITPASGRVYHEDVALLGGWRLKDWEAKKKG